MGVWVMGAGLQDVSQGGLGSPSARGQGLDSGLGEQWGDSWETPGWGLRFLLEAGKPEGTGGRVGRVGCQGHVQGPLTTQAR